MALQPPTLFVKGDADELCCTPFLVRLLLSGQMAAADMRLLVLPVSTSHNNCRTYECLVHVNAQKGEGATHPACGSFGTALTRSIADQHGAGIFRWHAK